MKDIILLLATIWVASNPLYTQKLQVIDFDYNDLRYVTSSADLGTLTPISDQKSLINIGQTHLAIIDNHTGKLLKKFDDQSLQNQLAILLQENYPEGYCSFTDEEIALLPICQKQRFVYQRFYKIEGIDKYACEVICFVKSPDFLDDFILVSGVAFFNKALELLSFHEREPYNSEQISSSLGGFFIGEKDFYIKKAIPELSEKADFIHFRLMDNKFQLVGALSSIDASNKPNLSPGRHLSMHRANQHFYLNNGTDLVKTPTLNHAEKEEINMHLADNEVVGILTKMNDRQLVGVRMVMDEIGAAWEGILFQTDLEFNHVTDLVNYDQLQWRINSIATHNNKIYIFLWDKKNEKYLLEIRETKSKT